MSKTLAPNRRNKQLMTAQKRTQQSSHSASKTFGGAQQTRQQYKQLIDFQNSLLTDLKNSLFCLDIYFKNF